MQINSLVISLFWQLTYNHTKTPHIEKKKPENGVFSCVVLKCFIPWGIQVLFSQCWDMSNEFRDIVVNSGTYLLNLDSLTQTLPYKPRHIIYMYVYVLISHDFVEGRV